MARPLTVQEFDSQVPGSPLFDAEGLVVALREGAIVGFVHAGFGPESPEAPPFTLSRAFGTIGMLVTEPGLPHPDEVEIGLFAAAEGYLTRQGAQVVYAGGQYPLNPFYWGIYGGSEWAGILDSHSAFLRAATRAGYEPVAQSTLLERNLDEPDARDPRAILVRRQVRLDVAEDVLPASWWDSLAIGEFRPTSYRLVARADETPLARATSWDMTWFGRLDGRSRIGLIDVEVHPDHRRKGYGRFLLGEIFKRAREEGTAAVAVQTRSVNTAAIGLYAATGFAPVESATLFRRAGSP